MAEIVIICSFCTPVVRQIFLDINEDKRIKDEAATTFFCTKLGTFFSLLFLLRVSSKFCAKFKSSSLIKLWDLPISGGRADTALKLPKRDDRLETWASLGRWRKVA